MRHACVFIGVMATLVVAGRSHDVMTQAPIAADGWSGQVQCTLSVTAKGYEDTQTHTWTLSGAPPVARSGFRDYPATWTIEGGGSRALPTGPSTSGTETWTRGGSDATAAITIFEPIGSAVLRIAPGQKPARAIGGLRTRMQSGTGGVTTPPAATADEWRFPYIDTVVTGNTMSGTRTETRTGVIGWRQPLTAPVTETCTWNFTRGAAGSISRGSGRLGGAANAGNAAGGAAAGATNAGSAGAAKPDSGAAVAGNASGAAAGADAKLGTTGAGVAGGGAGAANAGVASAAAPAATAAEKPTTNSAGAAVPASGATPGAGSARAGTTGAAAGAAAGAGAAGAAGANATGNAGAAAAPTMTVVPLNPSLITVPTLAPAPRTIALAGFTATGVAVVVAPRAIDVNGFTATGSAVSVSPRSIPLTGFIAHGDAAVVPPRAIPVTGFTAVGENANTPRGRGRNE